MSNASIFNGLPERVRNEARTAYRMFKQNPQHPRLDFKTVTGKDGLTYYSVRIGIHYRALGDMRAGELYWFWLGTHGEYDKLLA